MIRFGPAFRESARLPLLLSTRPISADIVQIRVPLGPNLAEGRQILVERPNLDKVGPNSAEISLSLPNSGQTLADIDRCFPNSVKFGPFRPISAEYHQKLAELGHQQPNLVVAADSVELNWPNVGPDLADIGQFCSNSARFAQHRPDFVRMVEVVPKPDPLTFCP